VETKVKTEEADKKYGSTVIKYQIDGDSGDRYRRQQDQAGSS
jgi:hypothetical protein